MCDFADIDSLVGVVGMLGPCMVMCSYDACICRSRLVSVAISENDDYKLDLLVKELKRYHVCIAVIQETK